jgi:hypothetical protein
MPSIEILIPALLLTVVGYLLVHQRAAYAYEFATYRVLPVWSVSLVAREFIGVCVRRLHRLRTYSALDDAYAVLGLDPVAVVSADQVRSSYQRVSGDMDNAPWAYPDSQHEAILGVAWEFGCHVKNREVCAFVRQNLAAFSPPCPQPAR